MPSNDSFGLNGLTDEQLQAVASGSPSIITTPGMQASSPRGITGNVDKDFPGGGQALFNFATQNLPMAAASTFAMGPAGALTALNPPRDFTDATLLGLTAALGPVYQKTEEMIQGAGNKWLRTALRGAFGLANEGANAVVRKTIGEQNPTSPGALAFGALAPMAGGVVAERGLQNPHLQATRTKVNIQKTLDQLDQGTLGQAPPTRSFSKQVAPVYDELRGAQQQAEQQQQFLQQYGKQLQDAVAERDKVLTAVEGTLPEGQRYRQAKLAASTGDLDKMGPWVEPADQPYMTQIGKLQERRKWLDTTGLDLDQPGATLTREQQVTRLGDIDRQIELNSNAIVDRKMAALKQASQAYLQDDTRFQSMQQNISGLQQTYDDLKNEATNNPLENVHLKALVGGPNGTLAGFIKNLEEGDPEQIEQMYKYFGTRNGGRGDAASIARIQDAFVSDMFAKAYDAKTGLNPEIFRGDGPYNKGKLEAVFGGGVDGANKAQALSTLYSDLSSLQRLQGQMGQGGGITAGKIARIALLPTAMAFSLHHPSLLAAEGLGAVGQVGVLSYNKLVNMALDNPKFAQAFHNWATTGGGTIAGLRSSTILNSAFTRADKK